MATFYEKDSHSYSLIFQQIHSYVCDYILRKTDIVIPSIKYIHYGTYVHNFSTRWPLISILYWMHLVVCA